MDLNRVTLIGNLVSEPDQKSFGDSKAMTLIRIATNRVFKDSSGKKNDEVEFHKVVGFGRTGEIMKQFLKKGSKVFLEGRLRTTNWTDKEQIKRYNTEIVADKMIMLSSKGGQSGKNEPVLEEVETGTF